MTKQLKEIEIPFGAKDSELCDWEYTIPEGMEATIVDNKIVVKKKDSGDERIRKALLNEFIHLQSKGYKFAGLEGEEIVAWIEKQGEQKPTQEIEPTPIFKIGDILRRKGKDYTFRVDRIQGGYYHCDRNHGAFFPIEEQGNWELVEQKPAWSEEDEKTIDEAVECLENYAEYVQGGFSKQHVFNLASRVESLKDRYFWKPSNTQLHYLSWIANIKLGDSVVEQEVSKHLNELLEDLKKLREE